MTKKISFIGDPGEAAAKMLGVIREAGFEPERLQPNVESIKTDGLDPPVLFIIAHDVSCRSELIGAIRERPKLAPVPVLGVVRSAQPEDVNEALAQGVDDFMVDGDVSHLSLLLAVLEKSDSWHAVRAPTGLVVLAEEDRAERVRLAHVLKRNGFDIMFAANVNELKSALEKTEPRAVVTSCDLPDGSVVDILASMSVDSGPVGVLVVSDKNTEVPEKLEGRKISILERGCDPEQLTFVMNELLMPPPPNVRRTPRVLYSTPVSVGVAGLETKFMGAAYNINLNGLFVRTLAPLPMQTVVEVCFRPPYGRGEVRAFAQVMWVRAADEKDAGLSPSGMGLQFIDWAPADYAAFEAGYGLARKHSEHNEVSFVPSSHVDVTQPPPPLWDPDMVMELSS